MGIVDRPNLAVLRHAGMPSIIVEVGFLSNQEDARLLASSEFRMKTAEALCDGIKAPLKKIDTTEETNRKKIQGFDAQPSTQPVSRIRGDIK